MDEEIWLPIDEWEGLYEVSDHGRVRSLDRWVITKGGSLSLRKGKIMMMNQLMGYMRVILQHKPTNRYKLVLIHRLVGQTFIPNPNNLPLINHKNLIRDDNRVENLEWCTHHYNVHYDDAHNKGRKKVYKIIYQYDMEFNFIKEWPAAVIAEREGGFRRSKICEVANGKRPHHKNFIWSYDSPDKM